jgi:hypothetical protein
MIEKYNQDGSINEQWVAVEISKCEGKKVEVNIAQITEVMNCAYRVFCGLTVDELLELIGKQKGA